MYSWIVYDYYWPTMFVLYVFWMVWWGVLKPVLVRTKEPGWKGSTPGAWENDHWHRLTPELKAQSLERRRLKELQPFMAAARAELEAECPDIFKIIFPEKPKSSVAWGASGGPSTWREIGRDVAWNSSGVFSNSIRRTAVMSYSVYREKIDAGLTVDEALKKMVSISAMPPDMIPYVIPYINSTRVGMDRVLQEGEDLKFVKQRQLKCDCEHCHHTTVHTTSGTRNNPLTSEYVRR